jgi:hypothetical protein
MGENIRKSNSSIRSTFSKMRAAKAKSEGFDES